MIKLLTPIRASWVLLLALVSCTTPAPTPAPPPAPALSADPAAKEDIAPEAATGYEARKAVVGSRQMVAAANPHASRAGMAMLKKGGSAVDAAIAMALTLTLVEPQSSGIGGGAFMLSYDASSKRIDAFDGRETAPASAREDMFLDPQGKPRGFFDAVVGGLSVGVPGEIRMLWLAHQQQGHLPWKDLFEPAIQLAEDGFAISPRLHALLAWDPHLPKAPGAAEYFYQGGAPKPVGTVLENPALAEVLRAVAEGGPDAFYEGPIAADIVTAVRGAFRNPGGLSAADLAGYQAVRREALCGRHRAHLVCGMPPPSSGGSTVLSILGILEARPDAAPLSEPLGVHLFAEASRLAFADRDRYLADPDFVAVPAEALVEPSYLKKRAAAIGEQSMGEAAPGELPVKTTLLADDQSGDLPGTSHMVAIDAAGNVVSMTASIESAFGSHVMVRGFLLNNELTDFSFVPRVAGRPVANRVAPKKRPRSSMAPMIVLTAEGREFELAVGSPGGSRIIDYVARVLVAVLDHGTSLQAAVDAPNVSNRNGPTELEKIEGQDEWLRRTQADLERRGHEVKVVDLNSGLQAVGRVEGKLVGAADPRREGLVLAE
ncbi:MAG: gamma-glutamyltransferase [Polyangiaceae bacterium]